MLMEQQGFVPHLVSAQCWSLDVSVSLPIPVGPLAIFPQPFAAS